MRFKLQLLLSLLFSLAALLLLLVLLLILPKAKRRAPSTVDLDLAAPVASLFRGPPAAELLMVTAVASLANHGIGHRLSTTPCALKRWDEKSSALKETWGGCLKAGAQAVVAEYARRRHLPTGSVEHRGSEGASKTEGEGTQYVGRLASPLGDSDDDSTKDSSALGSLRQLYARVTICPMSPALVHPHRSSIADGGGKCEI